MVGGPPRAGGGPQMSPLEALLMNTFIDEHIAYFVARMGRGDQNIIARLMADGTLTPVIDRHYPLSEVSEAIAYSEEGRARGKIILDVP
jgi:NADPH:quinone reductase-like Zn-dependent oxidoreductase